MNFFILISITNCIYFEQIFSKAVNDSRDSYNLVDIGIDSPKNQALIKNEMKLDEFDDDNFIEMWNKMNSDEDKLGSLRGYNRRRKPPEYYDNNRLKTSTTTTTSVKSKTMAISQSTRFLKEFLKKTSTFLSLSEFLQSKNLTLVDFLKKSDREVKELLTTKPLFIVQKGSIPIKKNKLALKPQIVTVNHATTSTTIPVINETYLLNERTRAEIYEVFSNTEKRTNLLRILTDLNMTLNDLIEHRERGSSHRHLAEIFHRNIKEPEVYDNSLIIEQVQYHIGQKINSETTEATDTSSYQGEQSTEIFIIPIPTNRSILLPNPSPTILVVNIEDTILVTLSIITVTLLGFLTIYAIYKIKQTKHQRLLKVKNETFLNNKQKLDRFIISKARVNDYDYRYVNYFSKIKK